MFVLVLLSCNSAKIYRLIILGDPGAASLFAGQKRPWELTLTEPVPEIFEFVPLIGHNQRRVPAGELCRLLTRCGFLLRLACTIGRFSWRVSEKDATKPRESQTVTWVLRNSTLRLIFMGDLPKVYR